MKIMNIVLVVILVLCFTSCEPDSAIVTIVNNYGDVIKCYCKHSKDDQITQDIQVAESYEWGIWHNNPSNKMKPSEVIDYIRDYSLNGREIMILQTPEEIDSNVIFQNESPGGYDYLLEVSLK